LERDRLYLKLKDIPGLKIPPTLRKVRAELEQPAGLEFPFIIRPFESHAGFGLAKIESAAALHGYLEGRTEQGFFVSPFIDYASSDGMFRKYRIALIDGKAYAVHMAIAEEWKVWYLNADMALSRSHRLEEACFMQYFDENFAARHAQAIRATSAAIGLDYVLVDCAETREGELLIFEADHCAIVHDMDPVNVYPYKPGQMQKIYAAFAGMLKCRAVAANCRAA
jgi:glutathione synthase/RimK-type ligase-like ATP-grasp enzyme